MFTCALHCRVAGLHLVTDALASREISAGTDDTRAGRLLNNMFYIWSIRLCVLVHCGECICIVAWFDPVSSTAAATLGLLRLGVTFPHLPLMAPHFHAALAFWEYIGTSAGPALHWWPAVIEILLLLVYVSHLGFLMSAYGLSHFFIKKWSMVILIECVACLIDWLFFYGFGLHGMFRFARPFRPLLLVALSPSLRRYANLEFNSTFILNQCAAVLY
jgi:hypothetical protein